VTGSGLTRWAPAAAVGAAFVASAGHLFWLVNRHAVDVPFHDQWDFLGPEFDGRGLWAGFWFQHGPHRQGLGALVMAALHQLTGWNLRVDALAGVIIVALATGLLLAATARLTGRLTAFDAAIPLMLLSVHAYDLYLGTVNLAHGPLPALLVAAFVLALQLPPGSARLGSLLAINALAVFTGFGLCLGAVTPLVLGLELWRARALPAQRPALLWALAAALGTLGLFAIGYKNQPAAECFRFPDDQPSNYPLFMGRMMATAMGSLGARGLRPIMGLALLALLAGAFCWALWRVVRSKSDSRTAMAALSLTGFGLVFAGLTAVGRVCFGLEAAEASRYVIYCQLGFVGVYLLARDAAGNRRLRWALLSAAVVFLGVKEVYSAGDWRQAAPWYESIKRGWVACYLEREDAAGCNAIAGYPIHPSPDAAELPRKLAFLKSNRLSLFR
jgi:hypothetical protein